MPDLQMLIDICNIYHISLDKLLNEDNKFVNKIDFYGRIGKILKLVSVCSIIVVVLFAIVFFRWKMIATDKNEAFAQNAKELGFVLKDGFYQMEEDDVHYQLPNQKLPFLKEDFFVKNSSADFSTDETEISITIHDNENNIRITLNHNRSLEGEWTETERLNIVENSLNDKENELLKEKKKEIRSISGKLVEIHNSVYSDSFVQ